MTLDLKHNSISRINLLPHYCDIPVATTAVKTIDVLNCDLSIYFITAAPMMLAVSVASAIVPGNAVIVLSINVSADPAPTATWQLNGGDLPSTATAALK